MLSAASFCVNCACTVLHLNLGWVCVQSVRVVQRNLVYAVGLSMDICHEDILRSPEYFGQFGKPVKVQHPRTLVTCLLAQAPRCL